MKTFAPLLLSALCINIVLFLMSAQKNVENLTDFKPAMVDYDAFEKLTTEVKEHRKSRLVNLEEFKKLSKEEGVIVLDTRSDKRYNSKHIKGAIHLNFSDFTQDNLARIIPSKNTKILIYCNNNIEGDPIDFPTKALSPVTPKEKEITLALNIPTYINLYGYGYKNVYELSQLISVYDKDLELEGTSVSENDRSITVNLQREKAKVDFDTFEKLIDEVKEHRASRLVNKDKFSQMAKKKDVVILDTRSDAMYNSKHIKGAIHLNFSDFTQDNLAKLIPSKNTKILIYCNNNFEDDPINFTTKAVTPYNPIKDKESLTLALNIPTYINLYGYGYRNVYELSELVSVKDKKLHFEGSSVRK